MHIILDFNPVDFAREEHMFANKKQACAHLHTHTHLHTQHRVASPPVTDPCFYGMDFPSKEELFANQHGGNKEAMAKWLGVTT
jgi:hypothetical protein